MTQEQRLFSFTVKAQQETPFTVESFTCRDNTLSADYCFAVTVQTDHVISVPSLIGKAATLFLDKDKQPIHGIVKYVSYRGKLPKGHQYLIELASPLFLLKNNVNSRVFLKKNVVEVLEMVLADIPFAWQIGETYPEAEFTLQYDETDYAFLCRLMAKHGLFFSFDQQEEEAILTIMDGGKSRVPLECGDIPYLKITGSTRDHETVFSLQPQASMITESVEVKDYNHRTPQATITSHSARRQGPSGTGKSYQFGEHVKDISASDRAALIRIQASDAQRLTLTAETDCKSVAPGRLISIAPEGRGSQEYLIISASHEGDQSHGIGQGLAQSGFSYKNTLTLIPAQTPYRSPLGEERRILATFTAFVESSSEYGYLDENGKYHIRLDLDNHDPKHGATNGSHPIRLSQPYVGQDYGFHFPLHQNTEVVLTCVNGDIDRPVILGVLPNPDTASPVTSTNPYENIIRTAAHNELVMSDEKQKERVDLFTKEKKNILSLDADSQGNKVRLASEEGRMETYAAKTMYMESKDTHTMLGGNEHIITVENSHRLMTRKKDIKFEAGTDIRLKAGENVYAHAEEEDITLTAGSDMVVEVGQAMTVEVRNKDLTLAVTSGGLSISAAKNLNILGSGQGAITISQGGGSVEIASSGDITINATNCNIDGGSLAQVGSTSNLGQ